LISKDHEPHIEPERRETARELPDLIEQLESPDEQSRRWAVRDLAAYPEAVGLLVSCMQSEPSRAVRVALFTSLLRIDTAEARESLVELLRSDDAELRNGAIDILKTMSDEAAPLVERLMTDDDPDVRIFAVNIMGSLRYPEVPNWLAQLVANDTHVNVCCTAVDLLCEVGDLDAIPALEAAELRFPEEPYVAFAVRSAIETIRRTNSPCS